MRLPCEHHSSPVIQESDSDPAGSTWRVCRPGNQVQNFDADLLVTARWINAIAEHHDRDFLIFTLNERHEGVKTARRAVFPKARYVSRRSRHNDLPPQSHLGIGDPAVRRDLLRQIENGLRIFVSQLV